MGFKQVREELDRYLMSIQSSSLAYFGANLTDLTDMHTLGRSGSLRVALRVLDRLDRYDMQGSVKLKGVRDRELDRVRPPLKGGAVGQVGQRSDGEIRC